MKINAKKIALASLLALGASTASAVPAYPGLIEVRQADGTELSIRRIGDEYSNLVVTTDGYPLSYNTKTRNYEYATFRDGRLEPAGIVATAEEARDAAALTFLASVDREREMAAFDAGWRAARNKALGSRAVADGPQRIVRISDVPTLGKHDVLVILVDFDDVKFSDNAGTPDPEAYYERFFHEKGFSEFGATGSAHDFYYEGSCERYDPQFRVFGPVAVKGMHSDYAGQGGSAYTYQLIEEAVKLVDEQYDVDFKDFDTDGDGKVDNVYCLYAGYGQADSSVTDAIWPHSWELHNREAEFDVDGVTFDRYTVSQQVNGQSHNPVGIGTFVHEFGHVLGFADHYNNSSSFGNPPNNVGQWDVMSQGTYNNDQNTPPTFSAFERYSLGWTEPEMLDPKHNGIVEIAPYIGSGQCYRVDVKAGDKEYFLIENRQQEGWDTYLPGHGVLVWHIEEDQLAWDNNRPNYDQTHQMVDIVEAADIYTASGSPSDPFPGSRDIISYTFKDWNNRTAFGFDWVEEDEEGNCRFLLSGTDYKIPSPEVKVLNVMGKSATLALDGNGPAICYEVSVAKEGEEVFAETLYELGEIPLTGLEPETEYTVNAKAILTTLTSELVEVGFKTLPLQIEEKTPEILSAENGSDTGFTARWMHMPEAVDYAIDIYASTHDGEGLLTYGFDNFSTSAQNLPEGWTLTAKQTRYENDFGEAAPSLRMRDDDATLMMTMPGNTIDKVDFWFMPSKAGLILTAEKCVGGEWSEVWHHVADRKKKYNESVETAGADSVRLVLTREEGVSGGFLLLDDINVHYVYDRFTPYGVVKVGPSYADAFNMDGNGICSYEVTGLDPSQKYAYSVQALDGERGSLISEVLTVEVGGGMSVEAVEEADDRVVIYNLQGMRINRDVTELPSGLYIINGKKVMVRR